MEQFLLSDLQRVFPMDALASSHPISVEVDHPKKIKQLFDRISYSKVSSGILLFLHFTHYVSLNPVTPEVAPIDEQNHLV